MFISLPKSRFILILDFDIISILDVSDFHWPNEEQISLSLALPFFNLLIFVKIISNKSDISISPCNWLLHLMYQEKETWNFVGVYCNYYFYP